MSKATDQQWRVQVKHAKNVKWKNAGLFETRERAREESRRIKGHMLFSRVIPYVKAKKGEGK